MSHQGRRLAIVVGVLAATLGFDQLTKQVAIATLKGEPSTSYLGDFLRVGYAENPGAFLGLGGALPGSLTFWLLTVGVGVLLLAAGGYLFFSKQLDVRTSIWLALVVGGGFSNWIDRLFNDGRVVDFLNLGIGSIRTGIFNVADIAIMGGAIAMLLLSRRDEPAPSSGQ